MKVSLPQAAAISLFVTAAPACALVTEAQRPSITGEATYLSTEIHGGVRSEISVKDGHFTVKAVGTDGAGIGSHHGGMISVTDNSKFFYFEKIGIPIPKPNVTSWNIGKIECSSFRLKGGILSIGCEDSSAKRNFSYLISSTGEVLHFTGMCLLNREHVCQYTLVSGRGISIRGIAGASERSSQNTRLGGAPNGRPRVSASPERNRDTGLAMLRCQR